MTDITSKRWHKHKPGDAGLGDLGVLRPGHSVVLWETLIERRSLREIALGERFVLYSEVNN